MATNLSKQLEKFRKQQKRSADKALKEFKKIKRTMPTALAPPPLPSVPAAPAQAPLPLPDLPLQVLQHVFSFLPPHPAALAVAARVARPWAEAAAHCPLWRTIAENMLGGGGGELASEPDGGWSQLVRSLRERQRRVQSGFPDDQDLLALASAVQRAPNPGAGTTPLGPTGESVRVVGLVLPVEVSRNGCRCVRIGGGAMVMRQNEAKASAHARAAREGRAVSWLIRGNGPWVQVMDGQVIGPVGKGSGGGAGGGAGFLR